MSTVLLAWIGDTDLRAPVLNQPSLLGPIATALAVRSFDRVVLLTDRDPTRTHKVSQGVGKDKLEVRVDFYVDWLRDRGSTPIELRYEKLDGPTNYKDIYEAARRIVDEVRADGSALTFHVSPGTPAMGAVWLLLAKTHAPATLLESSFEDGVRELDLPFRIAAEFLPDDRELSPAVQVRLLRALQRGEVVRVGSSGTQKVNVPVLAATHRDLPEQIELGRDARKKTLWPDDTQVILVAACRRRPKDGEQLGAAILLLAVNVSGKPSEYLARVSTSVIESRKRAEVSMVLKRAWFR